MDAPNLTLHHFPGACSRVTLCALEMSGLDYSLNLVNIAAGEQTGKTYKAISALGKVPALVIDGVTLLENSAILTFIHLLRPDAGIFPQQPSLMTQAEQVGGMSFCAGTLHPILRGLLNPQRLTTGDGEPVRERSRELAAKSFNYANSRLAERGWWLGEFSIVDVYLDWACSVARKAGFDLGDYSRLAELESRLQGVPAYARMLEIEVQSLEKLGLS